MIALEPATGWAIVARVHPDCETCDEWAEAAIATAQIMGSIGGGAFEEKASYRPFAEIDPGAHTYQHGARVLRADLWDGTRLGSRGPRDDRDFCHRCDRITRWDEETCRGCGREWGHG